MKQFIALLAFSAVAATVSGQQLRRGGRQQAAGGYGAPPAQPQYGALDAAASEPNESHSGDHQGLDWLLKSVPGQPGTDYPIFAEVPETAFICDGQVEGGYYADPEAECQAFHVCTADGLGSLAKYSFLCPNGTIFNQEYFICDWWFNFDCSSAEGLYSLNEDIAAEREAISEAQAAGSEAAASSPQGSYASPAQPSYGVDQRSGRRFNN